MTDITERAPSDQASTADLVRRAGEQVSRLVRDEIVLARAELTGKAKAAGTGAGLLGGGAVLALYGLAVLLAAAVLGLAVVLPAWLSALIVGVAVIVIAGLLVLAGRSRLKRGVPPVPTEAMHGVQADIDTLKGKGRP